MCHYSMCLLTAHMGSQLQFNWGRESSHFSLAFIRPVNPPTVTQRNTAKPSSSTCANSFKALPVPLKLQIQIQISYFHFVQSICISSKLSEHSSRHHMSLVEGIHSMESDTAVKLRRRNHVKTL